MNIVRRGTLTALMAGLVLASALFSSTATSPPDVLAVEPGVNCSPYEDGVCVIEVGDIWFCESTYEMGLPCLTSIAAGDTVRWEYPSSGLLIHTTTACGADCEVPTLTPLWDSGIMDPGESFEFTLTEPGQYQYYCTFHQTSQMGLIRVLEPAGEPTVPAAPTDLEAIVVQDALLVTLVWRDNAGNEESHVVERSTAGPDGPWAVRATLASDSSEYTDSGLEDGVTYWYRVASMNDAGMSGYSNVASGTATALPTPSVTGDVNCDDGVNSLDAAFVLQFDVGLLVSLPCEQNADVNGDGATNAIDAALILQLDAGLIDDLGPPPEAQEVTVSLIGFAVVADPPSADAGAAVLQTSNDGATVHTLRVIRTGLNPDALPVDSATRTVDEQQVEVVARSENLAPRETESVRTDLEAGSYVLICNIPTHYQAGMFTGFTVE